MPETPRAVARCDLPVPVPPMKTTLCGGVGEGEIGQFVNQAFIDLGLFEVEAGEVAVNREAGGLELIMDGAHRLVDLLGLKQVLDQPT